MANFPRSARTGQTHKKFGRRFIYSETTESWTPISTLASVAEVRTAEQAVSASNTTTYQTAVELPLSGNTAGAMAFVVETNRLYLWSGTGWYNIATIAGASSSISGANSSYTLAADGTPTVVTLSQSGLTSPTWSYEVTTGSLARTATVTQADNVFTITPSTRARDVGSFGLTFKATDGSNTIVTSSQFTMSNTAPVIGTGPSATYTLAEDGTPTVITLAATDADGHAITWSYEVVSGSLGSTTVTNVGSVFTITPSTDTNDAGTFQLRFVASDGAASDTDVAEFTLAFGPDWSAATQQKIQASDKQASDQFGASVAISGETVIVGAVGDNNYYGSARVFIKSGSTWNEQATLVPSDSIQYSNFGYSVDIDGDTAVVGANSQSNSNGNQAGAAYVYTRSGSTWTQQAKLLASDAAGTANANDGFGVSVSIDGDTIAVGAYGAEVQGATYIYTRSGTSWTEQAKLLPSDLSFQDNFGFSVSIDGDTVVVGSKWQDTGGSEAGAAYIFVRSGVTWTQQAKIQASDKQVRDEFGWSVDIDGDTVIVGAWLEDTVASNAGAAYIFTRSGTTWTEQAKIQNDDPILDDRFGVSVAISGDTAVVGNYFDDTSPLSDNGSACIFTRSGSTWTQQATLLASDKGSWDEFGSSVDIDGDTVVVGSKWQDTGGANAGSAYIFQAG